MLTPKQSQVNDIRPSEHIERHKMYIKKCAEHTDNDHRQNIIIKIPFKYPTWAFIKQINHFLVFQKLMENVCTLRVLVDIFFLTIHTRFRLIPKNSGS